MVEIGSKMKRKISDYKLSRYACYLIARNADPRKKIIALAQTYFAIQTRKQELLQREYSRLSEAEKRFYQRDLTKRGNYLLNKTAASSGVKNFDKFHNAGYKGLYNGETANEIAKRKGLRYREDILERERVNTEAKACNIHYDIGRGGKKYHKKNWWNDARRFANS